MKNSVKLVFVKLLHTLIWVFFNIVIFYFLYGVVTNQINAWVWICLGLILLESFILLIFKTICPVTLIARRYSNSTQANFDIYLPNWLARYNKEIYSVIVFAGIVILVYRLLT